MHVLAALLPEPQEKTFLAGATFNPAFLSDEQVSLQDSKIMPTCQHAMLLVFPWDCHGACLLSLDFAVASQGYDY